MEGVLMLEDGTMFKGKPRGARGETAGEVVFNTSMTGYQEIITDPSYCGQIIVMTFPTIGNYGINNEDFESRRPFLRGFIAREICSHPSNWRSVMSLEEYLLEQNIVALEGVDTRALTRHIREKGAMKGIITSNGASARVLKEKLGQTPGISEVNYIPEVTTPEVYTLENEGPHLVILDLGLKQSIAHSLHQSGCRVTVVPASFTAEEITDLKPDGLVLSNGPGDPRMAGEAVKVVQALGGKLPILGICLGHQVVALALGAQTYKLKFGHRGANHPVYDYNTDKVYITAQNHGFAVEEDSLPRDVKVTQRNINDNTVEGLEHPSMNILSIQYHPEAFPGPVDSEYIFETFLGQVRS